VRFVDAREEYVGCRDAVDHTPFAGINTDVTGNVVGRMLVFDIEKQQISNTKRIRIDFLADSRLVEDDTRKSNALLRENVADERRTVKPHGRSVVSVLNANVSLRKGYEDSGVHQSRIEVNLLSFSVDNLS